MSNLNEPQIINPNMLPPLQPIYPNPDIQNNNSNITQNENGTNNEHNNNNDHSENHENNLPNPNATTNIEQNNENSNTANVINSETNAYQNNYSPHIDNGNIEIQQQMESSVPPPAKSTSLPGINTTMPQENAMPVPFIITSANDRQSNKTSQQHGNQLYPPPLSATSANGDIKPDTNELTIPAQMLHNQFANAVDTMNMSQFQMPNTTLKWGIEEKRALKQLLSQLQPKDLGFYIPSKLFTIFVFYFTFFCVFYASYHIILSKHINFTCVILCFF